MPNSLRARLVAIALANSKSTHAVVSSGGNQTRIQVLCRLMVLIARINERKREPVLAKTGFI